jgi:transcription elongation GreA/GreB family factor
MRLPHRPKQKMKQQLKVDEPLYLTKGGVEKMKKRLEQIQTNELPQAREDVRRTGEFGDFSENAEYQEAKWRMRRLSSQATSIEEKLKIVILIEKGESDQVLMGSTVVLYSADGTRRTFEMVGPAETDPVRGRLSYKSPLGARLMGREVGETIELPTAGSVVSYVIHEIK